MNTFNLKLDLDKTPTVPEWVSIRQGDKNGTTIAASIYDHGTLLTGSYGTRVAFRLPDGEHYYRKAGTFSSGVATVTIDETEAASVTGSTVGHFDILDGSTVIASTADFGVRIMRSATEGAEPGETYDDAIQEAIDNLNDAIDAIPDTVEGILEDHPEWTTTVQDGSVTDAKLVQSGGVLDRVGRLMYRLDNLLTATPAEGDAVTVADAAQTPVAGLALYGRSTQDGTPTPSAPVAIQSVTPNLYGFTDAPVRTSNGVTWTPQADGSIRAEGTATNTSYALGSPTTADFGKSYFVHLKKGGTYTATSFGRLPFNVFVMTLDGTTSTIAGYSADKKTFTVADECYVQLGPRVSSGTVTNTTYHIVLVEGSTASGAPIPYQNVGLWARGRNLAKTPTSGTRVNSGITWTNNADGSVTASGTATGNSWSYATADMPNINLPAGTYTAFVCLADGTVPSGYCPRIVKASDNTTILYAGGVGQFTLTEETNVLICVVAFANTVASNTALYLVIEAGSTAKPYQHFAESVAPIDLQGYELRSLPDGTRDEVTVSVDGRATLVQRVGAVTFDGATAENWKYSSSSSYSDPSNGKYCYYADSNVTNIRKGTGLFVASLASHYSLVSLNSFQQNKAQGTYTFSAQDTNPRFTVMTPHTTMADMTAWLASNNVTVLYPLATPQTIDLGTVQPVALQGPDMTAQMVPTAPFALTYERDLNLTLARLEAAIADAATA